MNAEPWSESDIERVRVLIAQGLSSREVGAILGRSRKAVISISNRRNLGEWSTKTRSGQNALPDDFAERWRVSSLADLAAYYGKSPSLMSGWAKRLGLVRYPPKPVAPKATVAIRSKPNASMVAPIDRAYRDMSRAGQAADFLRKDGPVWRCKDTGRPDFAGTHWRRGSAILTDDELIERAVYRGWDEHAWRRAA